MKIYTKPAMAIDMFDSSDKVLTGSGPTLKSIKETVTGESSPFTLDGKSGKDLDNVIALPW